MSGGFIAWLLGTRTGQAILLALAFVAGLIGLKVKWNSEGERKAKDEANRRTIDNVEKANEARRDADAANRAGAPDERVRKFYTD